MNKLLKNQTYYLAISLGSGIGALASFIQIIERISYAEKPLSALSCDINNTFSCSNVFAAWQSSVFGFSNSIMCLLFFGVMLGVGLSGLFSNGLNKRLRLVMHSFSVFFLLFGAWYLQQSAMVIGALCIFCIFCYIGVITINWAWLRINVLDLPLLSNDSKKKIQHSFDRGTDTFFWVLWGLAIAAMFIISF